MLTKSFNISLRNKINPFKKTIKVDSDKSISIRSFLIGSICQGISKTRNVLESEDVFSSIKCLKKLKNYNFYHTIIKDLDHFSIEIYENDFIINSFLNTLIK